MGLIDSSGCGGCIQASEIAPRVLYGCEALAVFRFGHLAHHFLKADDFADISVSRVQHLLRSVWLLNAEAKGCTEDWRWLRCKRHCGVCPTVLYCTLDRHPIDNCITMLTCPTCEDFLGLLHQLLYCGLLHIAI